MPSNRLENPNLVIPRTDIDLSEIGVRLKITLPKEYRDFMLAHAAELGKAGCLNEKFSPFYLDPEELISMNELERPRHSGTGCASPSGGRRLSSSEPTAPATTIVFGSTTGPASG